MAPKSSAAAIIQCMCWGMKQDNQQRSASVVQCAHQGIGQAMIVGIITKITLPMQHNDGPVMLDGQKNQQNKAIMLKCTRLTCTSVVLLRRTTTRST